MTRASHSLLRASRSRTGPGPRRLLLTAGLAGLIGVAGCTAGATPSVAPSIAAPTTAASAAASPATGTPGASGGSANQLKITGREYAFDAPASAPAGITSIVLTNQGKEEHQAQIAKLNEGVTLPQITDALKNPDPSAALKLVSLAGGPNGVQPGATVSTTANLTPGQYLFLCFLPAPDGLPHIAKGMVAPLQVTGTAATSDIPAGEATVTAKDFSFDVPSAPLKAGKHTISFVNSGPQPHEAGLIKLAPGVTVDQLKQMMSAPAPTGSAPAASMAAGSPGASAPAGAGGPPFTSAGGIAGVTAGGKSTFDIDVTAGNYAFICFIPDPATGKAHAELGMIAPVTVQ